MQDLEFDFVTSLLADPTQLVEVTDINPAMIGDEHMRTLLNIIRAREGKVAPAIVHRELLKRPEGERLLADFADLWGFGDDTRSVVDQFIREGMSAGSAITLGEQIREEFLTKTISHVLSSTKRELFANASDWANSINNKITDAVANSGIGADVTSILDGVDEAVADWEFRIDNADKVTGQRVGLGPYDLATGGLKAGEILMFGGHSGEGKSHVMIHMCLEAVRIPHDITGVPARAAYFSLEMNRKQMSQRFISHIGRVDMSARVADAGDRKRVHDAAALVKKLNDDGALTVVDPIAVSSLNQICRELIRLKQVNNINLAFVDYAQLINVGGDSKYSEIASISQRLKNMALTLDMPIVCGVQLNREALRETRSAMPRAHHIADGLDILRSADMLQFIWRPGMHLPATDIGPWHNIAVILTAKRRTGDNIPPLYYRAEYQYSSLAPVGASVAQELADKDAQALLWKPVTASNKYGVKP